MPSTSSNPDHAILFVDDEEMARKYFRRAYGKDFNVLTAESVAEAKDVLAEHGDEIGVLITDQRMPGGNGVILLRHVKEEYPQIVRLLTTAYSDLEDAIDAVNSGEILRYIVKPWDMKSLQSELSHALRFFHMQSERDQLIGEKLSVWQRMTEINRVRDLLVMAGSFSHLKHSVQGIRSMLLQAPVTVELFSDEHSLEMWGLLEDEVKHMLMLAESIKEATRCDEPAFEHYELSGLGAELTGEGAAGNITVDLAGELPAPLVVPELLGRLVQSLSSYFATMTGDQGLSLTLTGSTKGNLVVLSLRPTTNEPMEPVFFSVNRDLLVAFLLAAHHGGDVVLHKGSFLGADLLLPVKGEEIFSVGEKGFWLDEIFSLYET